MSVHYYTDEQGVARARVKVMAEDGLGDEPLLDVQLPPDAVREEPSFAAELLASQQPG